PTTSDLWGTCHGGHFGHWVGLNMHPHTTGLKKHRWQAAILLALGGALVVPFSAGAASDAGPPITVVVRGDGTLSSAAFHAAVAGFGGHVTREIGIIDGGTALLPASEASALRGTAGGAAVTPDAPLTFSSIGGYDPTADAASLYSTTQMIGAQRLWANGITGKGVGVAVIDTGVAPVQGLNGPGQVFNGPDLSFDSQAPALTYNDEYGHGTHMAGIIGGNDSYGTGTPYAGNSNQFPG